MDAKLKENAYLIDLILCKGDFDRVRFENAQDKINFILNFKLEDKYKAYQLSKVEAQYEMDAYQHATKDMAYMRSKEELTSSAEKELTARNIDVPLLLNETEKERTIADGLRNLGLEEKDINDVLKNGIKNAETDGEHITLTFKNDPKVKEILKKNEIEYKTTEKGYEVNASIVAQEGIEIENNKKNKKILEDNEITHYIKPDDPRKIFVPLRAKKVATLLAASVLIAPVPAFALQIILNQSGILDKLVDRHLLSLKQKKALENGQTVLATQRQNGKDVEQYLYKDQETGAVKRVNVNEIQFPKKLNGYELTPADIQRLKSGKGIEIVNETGERKTYVMDLRKPNGVAEFKFKKDGMSEIKTPTPISSDKDKIDYISKHGTQGVSDIYGTNGVNKERDSFLEKFGLLQPFKEYMNKQKELKTAQINGNPTGLIISKVAEIAKNFKNFALDITFDQHEKQSKGYRR